MTNRVVLGQLPSTNYGMRVSLPGADVLTCPDSDLTFSSELNRFGLVLLFGSALYSNTTDVTVPFGLTLPFIPACEAYYYNGTTNKPQSGNPFILVKHDSIVFPNGSLLAGKLLPQANLYWRYIVFNIPVGGNAV